MFIGDLKTSLVTLEHSNVGCNTISLHNFYNIPMSQAEEYLINIRLTEDTNIISINIYILIHNSNQPVKLKTDEKLNTKNLYYI